jgi:hypothetical protein
MCYNWLQNKEWDMTRALIVPVGSHNTTAFVRTDRVIGMEIVNTNLVIYMDGMPQIISLFDSKNEAAVAAANLANSINREVA